METELDWLKRWNLYSPKSTAIYDIPSDKEYTYSELYKQSHQLADKIQKDFNIERGDRVAIMSTNQVEFFPLFFALQRLAAILVPINFRLTEREVTHILQDSGAKLFIYGSEFQNLARNSSCRIWPFDEMKSFLCENSTFSEIPFVGNFEDPVMILYTSGTTGAPKGAVITHKMIFWNSINTGLRLNLTQQDVSLCFLPLFHTGGWNVLSTPLLHRGAKLIFLEKFDPKSVLELCDKHKVTILFGVPTTMDMMSREEAFKNVKLNSVRYAIVGGEPMPLDSITTWHNKGIPVRQGYGLTEFGPNVFSLNEEDAIRKMGSIGFPNFYIEAKVIDSNGHECTHDEIGELVLKGPMCMKEYWHNPKATEETIVNGWLHTGDLVRKDAEGFFYVVGRKKEMFISGGENVYPAEVEQVIHSHPSVREVAVIGVKDSKWGEVGKAFVSLEAGQKLNIEELQSYCLKNLAKFKVPKYYEVLPELPKGDSGKILKRQLQ